MWNFHHHFHLSASKKHYAIIRFSQRASERFAAEILTRKLKSISDALSEENAIVTAEWICGVFWDITGEEMVK